MGGSPPEGATAAEDKQGLLPIALRVPGETVGIQSGGMCWDPELATPKMTAGDQNMPPPNRALHWHILSWLF